MKIAVCLKLVPATTADIRVAPDGKSLQLAGVVMETSAYDAFALEAALKLRDAFPGSAIHALTVGPDDAAKCLQDAFALGVNSATHVKAGLDARGAAHAAAAVLKPLAPDLVLCGRQAIDDDQWLFPGALAELLDLPHVTAASALEVAADGKSAQCRRRFNDGEQLLRTELPAVVSCDRGMNEPRVPTLKGRLDAKKKQAEARTAAELGMGAELQQPALRDAVYSPPPQKSPGKVITSPPAEAAAELVRLLREEAKIV